MGYQLGARGWWGTGRADIMENYTIRISLTHYDKQGQSRVIDLGHHDEITEFVAMDDEDARNLTDEVKTVAEFWMIGRIERIQDFG